MGTNARNFLIARNVATKTTLNPLGVAIAFTRRDAELTLEQEGVLEDIIANLLGSYGNRAPTIDQWKLQMDMANLINGSQQPKQEPQVS
ncbi:MAG: hypothetical protein NT019_02590 [Candidatus Adlerbacteria bacterium]|nr:hypothetical protein [Candidatus Adlerbacteria bacterium]